MPRICVTSKWWRRKDGSEETRKLAQHWKSGLRIAWINIEWKSELFPSTMMDLHPGLWSAGAWTTTLTKSMKKMENLITTKRWLPMQGVPLRQHQSNNQLHHYFLLKDVRTSRPTEVEWYSCDRLCQQESLFISSLEDDGVTIPRFFYHVGTSYDPFRIDCSRNKQVFFTAFDSVSDSQEETHHDVSKLRKAQSKTTC